MNSFNHILLIDDNELDNFISKLFLTNANIAKKISVMNSATEALEFLKNIQNAEDEFPDLILLDVRMPVMDGFGFLDEFTNNKIAFPATCSIMMLSSSNDQRDMDRAFKYPLVKRYLNKPLNIGDLNSFLKFNNIYK